MINPFFYRGSSGYYPYYGYRPFPYGNSSTPYNASKKNSTKKTNEKINISGTYVNNSKNYANGSNSSEATNDAMFEIFGVKLFFDDILLISLIFFLYNEGVQDKSLFIALILILLS